MILDITAMRAAPRCGAKNRAGTPCRAPAMRGRRRCRLHGGKNPGAPRGHKRSLKTGAHTDAGRAATAAEAAAREAQQAALDHVLGVAEDVLNAAAAEQRAADRAAGKRGKRGQPRKVKLK